MSLGHHAQVGKLVCETVVASKDNNFILFNPNPNTFVSFGNADGEKAYIRSDGTCSFVNQSALSFSGLSDVPNGYSGKSKKVVGVKSDETGLDFMDTLEVSSIESDVGIIKNIHTKSGKISKLECETAKIFDLNGNTINVSKVDTLLSSLGIATVDTLEVKGNQVIHGGMSVYGVSAFGDLSVDNLTVNSKLKINDLHITHELEVNKLKVMDVVLGNDLEIKKGLKVCNDTHLANVFCGSVEADKLKVVKMDSEYIHTGELSCNLVSTAHIHLSGDVLGSKQKPVYVDSMLSIKMETNKMVIYGIMRQPSDSIKLEIKTIFDDLLTEKEVVSNFQIYDAGEMAVPSMVSKIVYPSLTDKSSAWLDIKYDGNLTTVTKWVLIISLLDI
jgi:hypothetical protein